MKKLQKKSALNLSVSFLVIIIICIVVFASSVYVVKKFFTHAENIKMIYDERTEREIGRLLDDGSKVAIPFDKKTIGNGEFKTFGIGVLNMLNTGEDNDFQIKIQFNKAFNKANTEFCQDLNPCGSEYPNDWLKTSTGIQDRSGVIIEPTINNNEQKKFLLGVEPKNAPPGTYIFDLIVCYDDEDSDTIYSPCEGGLPDNYDTPHKLYVEVP